MRRHISLTAAQAMRLAESSTEQLIPFYDALYCNVYINSAPMPGFHFVQTCHLNKEFTGHIYHVDDALIERVAVLNIKEQLDGNSHYIDEDRLNLMQENVNTNMYIMFIKRKRVKENGTTHTKQGARKTPPRGATKPLPYRR